ncbi:MAG: PEP-CTERM sorting domain-containing protein [Phycisphaerae bacterium]|nr:PEP-CTERM sorting domain-containing protein [Phycisphaerae bacterium]
MRKAWFNGLLAGSMALLPAAASGAVIVSLQDITVVAEPAGGAAVTAWMDAFVRSDDPSLTLSSFQVHARIRDEFQRDVVTSSVGETAPRTQLLAGADHFASRPDSVTAIYAKFGFQPVPLLDEGGLMKIGLTVMPGVEGVYPIDIITSAVDPVFGTILMDGTFLQQIPYTAVSGSITVVIPEPAVGAGVGGAIGVLVGARRRRVG